MREKPNGAGFALSWYAVLRVAHSYWRWAVLLAAAVVFVRAAIGAWRQLGWTRADDRAARRFVAAIDIQFLLGTVLYFGFSPFFTAVYSTFSEAMKDQGSRFFGIEHQVAMLVASIVAHAGWDRARRAAPGPARHRIMRMTLLLFFAIVAWAIPWPWRPFGRPLFRTTW